MLGHTKVLGVLGHPITHSLSPVMHNAAIEALNIDYVYVPFHVLPEDLEQAVRGLRALSIAGVNVTIPHKEQIIEHLDEVGESAARIRSVNTVINCNGRLKGETTDGPGFLRSAEAAWGKFDGANVLILGAGGSAKAVAFALADAGCRIVIANRTTQRGVALAQALTEVFGDGRATAVPLLSEELPDQVRGADVLVNTSSVGMHPDVDGIPLSPELLRRDLLVYDLIYNPAKTRLVREAEARGAHAVTGLKMLVYQGALSFEMWTGVEAPIEVMENALNAHFVQHQGSRT